MRCSCCDKALSDFESTLKHGITGDYLDTCKKCLEGLSIPTMEASGDEEYNEEPEEFYTDISSYIVDEDDET